MTGRIAVVLIFIVLLIGVGGAVSFPVYQQSQWDRGTYAGTEHVNDVLQLSTGESDGTYESHVFDAGDSYQWSNLSVNTTLGGGAASVTVATSGDEFSTVQDRRTVSLSGGVERININMFDAARYVRFNYTLTRGTGTPKVSSTNVTMAPGPHFLIREDACLEEETELFSMSDRTNAHAANPGYYSDYRVCGSGIDRSNYERVCARVNTPTLSFFGEGASYTHLSTDDELYDYKLCTGDLSIGVRNECPASTKAIVSVYDLPDSHIAEPGFYDNQLCGAVFSNITLMMEFHLGQNDTVSLNGTANPGEGQYTNDDGWQSGFISAASDAIVSGIVAGENTVTTGIGYEDGGPDHLFNMTQPRGGGGNYYLPFTPGDHGSLEQRREMIASGRFMEQLNPNFGMAFVQETLVRLTLQLSNIDLVTDRILAGGTYRLLIQNLGTNADGEPRVSINVTAP